MQSADADRWMSMGYQMKREIKAKLVFLYYEILCEWPRFTLDRVRAKVLQSFLAYLPTSRKMQAISTSS